MQTQRSQWETMPNPAKKAAQQILTFNGQGKDIFALSHTRRDRSRGIRDEATACEPEVVSRTNLASPTGCPAVTVSISFRYPVLQC